MAINSVKLKPPFSGKTHLPKRLGASEMKIARNVTYIPLHTSRIGYSYIIRGVSVKYFLSADYCFTYGIRYSRTFIV